MNMRNLKYFSFGIISLIFASCIEEKNLSTQNEEDLENAELGLSTDFSLKTLYAKYILQKRTTIRYKRYVF